MTIHAFGLVLGLAVLLEAAAMVLLLVVALRHVRPRNAASGTSLAGAAIVELALASLCCVRAEGTHAATAAFVAVPDDGRLALLDVLAVGAPVAHAVAILLVVHAVRALLASS